MDTKIRKLDFDRFACLLYKSILLFSICFGIAFIFIALFLEELAFASIVFVFTILVSYLYKKNKVAEVLNITPDSITLRDGKSDVVLKKENIAYVFKNVRYTFSNKFMLIIATNDGTILTRKRCIVTNDSANMLLKLFINMEVPLKNFPEKIDS